MVSTKFYCGYDEFIYVSEWAEYGNMTVDHLKELELDFLDAMVSLTFTFTNFCGYRVRKFTLELVLIGVNEATKTRFISARKVVYNREMSQNQLC